MTTGQDYASGTHHDETIIVTRGLHKTFGDVRALQGVDLEVKGGVFGLVGPNGAGKTTLIRVLLGLVPPDSGSATVFGLDIRTQSVEIRQRTGVLHERPALPTNMTARRLLEMAGELYEQHRPPDELLGLVGLSEAADRKVGGFSAGMYQRLGIAHALVGCPRLVILDEPTSNLDVDGRAEVIELIRRIHRSEGVSFVISSHILTELERVCDTVAFLRKGRVLRSGTISELRGRSGGEVKRVITSDARALADLVVGLDNVAVLQVVDHETLLVTTDADDVEDALDSILKTAVENGLRVTALERAGSLEDIYREVMSDEQEV